MEYLVTCPESIERMPQPDDERLKTAITTIAQARTALPDTPLGLQLRLAISNIFMTSVPGYLIPDEVRPDFRFLDGTDKLLEELGMSV